MMPQRAHCSRKSACPSPRSAQRNPVLPLNPKPKQAILIRLPHPPSNHGTPCTQIEAETAEGGIPSCDSVGQETEGPHTRLQPLQTLRSSARLHAFLRHLPHLLP